MPTIISTIKNRTNCPILLTQLSAAYHSVRAVAEWRKGFTPWITEQQAAAWFADARIFMGRAMKINPNNFTELKDRAKEYHDALAYVSRLIDRLS